MSKINRQLADDSQLKVEKAQTAIVDASIIQTAGGKLRKAIKTNEENEVVSTDASKDKDARWTIKGGHWYLGYKLHMRTDEEDFVNEIHVTAANTVDVNNLAPVLN